MSASSAFMTGSRKDLFWRAMGVHRKTAATIGLYSDPMNAITPIAPPRRILVVDDDPGIRTLIASFLDRNGCETETACDTPEMRERLAAARFDLIVLDLMMPGEDGLTALKRLQATEAPPPVIMLSAVGSEIDRIIGLEVGAEDYLAKPCNPRELLARIHTVLRHTIDNPAAGAGSTPDAPRLGFGGWQMDLIAKKLFDPDKRFVYLTDGEFGLLRVFMEHPRRVLTRDQLLDYARGEDCESFDRSIDVQVGRLRRKLGPTDIIRTIRNEGYMFLLQPSVT